MNGIPANRTTQDFVERSPRKATIESLVDDWLQSLERESTDPGHEPDPDAEMDGLAAETEPESATEKPTSTLPDLHDHEPTGSAASGETPSTARPGSTDTHSSTERPGARPNGSMPSPRPHVGRTQTSPAGSMEAAETDTTRVVGTRSAVEGGNGGLKKTDVLEGSDAEDDGEIAGTVHVDRLTLTFSDVLGGFVVLERRGGRLRHPGTVAVRSPHVPNTDVYQELGATKRQALALQFVAAWSGSPFDAANVCARTSHVLCWGFWHFSGSRLASCLAAWKRRAPSFFEEFLGRYGMDVSVGTDVSGVDGTPTPARPTLRVLDPVRGAILRGRPAELLVARDPRLLATLARAGREPASQIAQIETAILGTVRPLAALKVPSTSEERALGELLLSARALAVIFDLALRCGLSRTIRQIQATWDGTMDEDAFLRRLVAYLRWSGQDAQAGRSLRIMSSPELDVREKVDDGRLV